jgi:hypothetical protein
MRMLRVRCAHAGAHSAAAASGVHDEARTSSAGACAIAMHGKVISP